MEIIFIAEPAQNGRHSSYLETAVKLRHIGVHLPAVGALMLSSSGLVGAAVHSTQVAQRPINAAKQP